MTFDGRKINKDDEDEADDNDDDAQDGDGDEPIDVDTDTERGNAGGGNRDDEDAVNQEPGTKAAFDALRGEYKNTWNMRADFSQDKGLQKRLRIATMCLEPLEKEFYRDCEEQQGGQADLARWAARRATGSWQDCIVETINVFHSTNTYQRLGMVTAYSPQPDDVELASVFQEDRQFCRMVYNLCIELIAARAWSQSMWGIFLPQLCAGLLSERPQQQQQLVLNMIKRVATTLLDAEKKTHIPGVRKGLDAIAFHKTQLVRELFQIGEDMEH